MSTTKKVVKKVVNAKKEVWRNVQGFDNYQVSNLGNVRNTNGRVLTPQLQSGKYYIRMQKNNVSTKVQVENVRKSAFSSKK